MRHPAHLYSSFFRAASFALVLCLFFPLTGCGGGKSGGKVLAKFDGGTVTEEDFNHKFESLPKQLQSVVLRNKKEFVEDLASEHFLLDEAERRGLSKEPEVKSLLDTARKKILVARLIEQEVDKKVTVGPDEARQYYDAHKEEFMTPVLLRASHILVKDESLARTLRAEVAAGADFEELARKHSIDSTSIRGGDVGFFQKGQLLPEFEEAAFAMKKGELRAEPLKSQFGYHVMKLTDRMEPTLRDFKAVRSMVEERLLNERRTKAFREFVERVKNGKKIQIDEKAVESLQPVVDSPAATEESS